MTTKRQATRSPAQRTTDLPRMLKETQRAVREALRAHKRAGNPVATLRDGRVVWIAPEQIPDA